MHALDRADDPVEQVDVVAGLVHEGAAVELPGAAPGGAVVVLLRAGPEHVDGDHVDAAEAALRPPPASAAAACALRRFCLTTNRRTPASSQARTIARPSLQRVAIGFSVMTWKPARGRLDGLLRVQSARRGEHDAVGLRRCEHRAERRMAAAPVCLIAAASAAGSTSQTSTQLAASARGARSPRSGWPRCGRSRRGRSGSCGRGWEGGKRA